jgi:hypothetical protein
VQPREAHLVSGDHGRARQDVHARQVTALREKIPLLDVPQLA